jgi:hypothetical protein
LLEPSATYKGITMATTDLLHKNLTDPQVHEPKGISTAEENTVYFANGTGTGEWKPISLEILEFTKGAVSEPVTEELPEIHLANYEELKQRLDGTVADAYKVGSDEAFIQCDKNIKQAGADIIALRIALEKASNNIKGLEKVVLELRSALLAAGIIIEQ